ncbi:hypothetical protein GIB67_028078 [Kingdonia uniflora]|uniref:Uncharacterized protein n=1 Tax=Kingdonia uniflora TaxID=39325 RepID=A0A7J7MLT9_9MAGN|nr:hypothetical protein GIB67_028078 [Kingdonia uniflora]
MNALMSCPGQFNGNIFEMMRVCEVLNQKWRDGGIARQFVADDVLKYYKFEYVKDQKRGYLFSDSAMQKFLDFESSGRPWCDHLVMVRGNFMQVPEEPALELIYKNFNEKPKPKVVVDTSSLFGIVSREGSELNKVLGELGIHGEKRLNSVVEKLSVAWKSAAEVLKLAAVNRAELVRQHDIKKAALQEQFEQEKMLQREQFEKEKVLQREQFEKADVDLSLAGKYGEIVFPGDDASPVAEQTPAPPVDDNPTKEEVVHLRGKVIEMEKALSRARDFINCTQQDKRFVDESDKLECQRSLLSLTLYFEADIDSERGLKEAYLELLTERDIVSNPAQGQKAMRILFFNIKNKDKKIHTQLENDLTHTCDELERCKGHNACLEVEKMADVITFYGSELERVENEFRRYISSCGKDVEVENDKVENMWFAKRDEGGRASNSKSRAEDSEEEEVEELLPHTRHKTRPQEVIIFNKPLQVDASGSKVEDKDNDNVAALSAPNKKLFAKLQQCLLAIERKTLLNSKLESEMLELQSWLNAVTVDLSSKDTEILTKTSGTMAANQQVLDLLSTIEKHKNDLLYHQSVIATKTDLLKKQDSEILYMRERLKNLNWDLREARDSCQRKNDRAKTHEEACSKRDRELCEIIDKCNSRIAALDRDKQALVQECIQGNEVFEELHAKYN